MRSWRLRGTRDLPRLGLVQIGALFVGGIVISVSLLFGTEQAGGGIYLLTQLIAVVLFVVRIWPTAVRVDWVTAQPIRHVAISALWVPVVLVLFMYVVATVLGTGTLPTTILIATDHAAYIGIVTNIMLGLLATVVLRAEVRRGWVGHLMFWGVNLGLIVFALGLLVDSAVLRRVGAPMMGIVLLVSLAVLAWTAIREPLEATEADLAAP